MKRIELLLFIIFFNRYSFSQLDWNLDYESANFAFLVVDYSTYQFEGGYFTKFPYYPGYDREYIPFKVIYNPPADYGNISFLYSATNDTIFSADIWWAGSGTITYPSEIESDTLFTIDSTIIVYPFTINYFNYVDEIPDSIFKSKADSAWLSIKYLSILNDFNYSEGVFRSALYLYAPAVGEFRAEIAKWIIFLYRGQVIVDVKEKKDSKNIYKLSQNYPNPFNPTTTISYQLPEKSIVTLKVYDILGREIAELVNESKEAGNYKVTFDASNLSSGIYYYQIKAGNFIQLRKMLLIK
ncbi:MAG: T9SS type A sorting domain-containing protein [Ignavibacteriales bacterium]|nr:T9SS type A sorting domain-containing protein [Ignavibacteriales bacterium]